MLDNYEGAGYGTLDLRTATWKSVNTVFTRLILDVGVDKTMALARTMGLSSVREYDGAIHCASVALGAESVSPLDMASAYGVFAARGERAEPTPCSGSPTATARPDRQRRAGDHAGARRRT